MPGCTYTSSDLCSHTLVQHMLLKCIMACNFCNLPGFGPPSEDASIISVTLDYSMQDTSEPGMMEGKCHTASLLKEQDHKQNAKIRRDRQVTLTEQRLTRSTSLTKLGRSQYNTVIGENIMSVKVKQKGVENTLRRH